MDVQTDKQPAGDGPFVVVGGSVKLLEEFPDLLMIGLQHLYRISGLRTLRLRFLGCPLGHNLLLRISGKSRGRLQPFTTVPPFGCNTWPVVYDESFDARNT